MKGRWRLWRHLIMSFWDIYPPQKKMKYASMANEACFIRQRSLLHLALKLTSFFYAKNRACGLTIFILNNMGKTSDCV